MKIALDTTIVGLKDGDRGGVHRYIVNLLSHIRQVDDENEYILFFNFMNPRHRKSCEAFFTDVYQEGFFKKISLFPPPLRMNLRIPLERFIGEIDIFHSPSHWGSPVNKAKSIVTIHDMAFKKTQRMDDEAVESMGGDRSLGKNALKSYKKRRYFFQLMDQYVPYSVRTADRLIAVSRNTRNDLIEAFPEAESKIKVIYEGVSRSFQPVKDPDQIKSLRKKYGIVKPYILYVGVLDPNKNLLQLLEAFKIIKSRLGSSHDMIFVGQKTWYYEVLIKAAERLGVKESLIFTGFIPERELPLFYSGADIFVLPAYFEGFGLPVLEAMSCGTPVVAANGGSLPEVVGDAGLLVDPMKSSSIADAVHPVVTQPALARSLREKGLERARSFTWEKMARETLALYKEVCPER